MVFDTEILEVWDNLIRKVHGLEVSVPGLGKQFMFVEMVFIPELLLLLYDETSYLSGLLFPLEKHEVARNILDKFFNTSKCFIEYPVGNSSFDMDSAPEIQKIRDSIPKTAESKKEQKDIPRGFKDRAFSFVKTLFNGNQKPEIGKTETNLEKLEGEDFVKEQQRLLEGERNAQAKKMNEEYLILKNNMSTEQWIKFNSQEFLRKRGVSNEHSMEILRTSYLIATGDSKTAASLGEKIMFDIYDKYQRKFAQKLEKYWENVKNKKKIQQEQEKASKKNEGQTQTETEQEDPALMERSLDTIIQFEFLFFPLLCFFFSHFFNF